MKTTLVASLLVVCASTAATSWGQDYPNRPIRIVVPTAPGGGPDVVARFIAPKLTEMLGQQIVIDNRAGANAMIGAEVVAKAPADGYTWLFGTGQNTTNPNEFIFPSYGSPVYWVTRGYAVLDDAAFPIVGEGKAEPNDTFVPQLVANARAAIDAVDALGYIDRKRVAVGGHSYGAFMTANLLTHSDLFAAGIARSGAYNRTLTPFGFQQEERNYWEAPEVYNGMSPFMHVDKMKTPLLLVHGEADNNSGTFTMQSERYFNALKGFGAPTRLVLLPKESHGYAAKESVLHLLWEQDQWLERHVKQRKPADGTSNTSPQ